MPKCQASGKGLSSPAVPSPVIALEGLAMVVATTQEGRMAEKKSFEGEKREQDSIAFLFCNMSVSFLFCKSFPLFLRHTLGKSAA